MKSKNASLPVCYTTETLFFVSYPRPASLLSLIGRALTGIWGAKARAHVITGGFISV